MARHGEGWAASGLLAAVVDEEDSILGVTRNLLFFAV